MQCIYFSNAHLRFSFLLSIFAFLPLPRTPPQTSAAVRVATKPCPPKENHVTIISIASQVGITGRGTAKQKRRLRGRPPSHCSVGQLAVRAQCCVYSSFLELAGCCCDLREHLCKPHNRGLNNKCYDDCMCTEGETFRRKAVEAVPFSGADYWEMESLLSQFLNEGYG